MRLATLLLFVLPFACTGTPQPDPPNIELPRVTTPLPPRGIGEIRLLGGPGAISPPGAGLWAVDLDGDAPPVTLPSAADGSFDGNVVGADGDAFRLQVVAGDARSEPVDVVLAVGSPIVPLAHALGGCLRAPLELEVSTTAPASVAITNACGADVVLGAVRVRTSPSPFSVVTSPTSIAAGETAEISVELTAEPATDEVLRIEIVSPAADLLATTLIGGSP